MRERFAAAPGELWWRARLAVVLAGERRFTEAKAREQKPDGSERKTGAAPDQKSVAEMAGSTYERWGLRLSDGFEAALPWTRGGSGIGSPSA